MIVIGCAGLAQAGKSSFCDIIEEELNGTRYIVCRCPMAGRLKEGLATMGITKDKCPTVYREAAQYFGGRMRGLDDNWWVNLASQDIKTAYDYEDGLGGAAEVVILIEDVRYPNEIELLQKWSGISVFIDAGHRLTDLDAEWRKHESEVMATDYMNGHGDDEMFDHTLSNNSTMKAFEDETRRLLPQLLRDYRP